MQKKLLLEVNVFLEVSGSVRKNAVLTDSEGNTNKSWCFQRMKACTGGHVGLEFFLPWAAVRIYYGIEGWSARSPLNFLENSKESRACLAHW